MKAGKEAIRFARHKAALNKYMVNYLYLILGSVLLLFTMVDMLWTTILPQGAGPMTSGICRGVSGNLRLLTRRGRSSLRLFTGPASLLATLLCWIVLLWVGWWLVYLGQPESVVNSTTGAAAGSIEKAYFVGFTIFTLGLGDYKPSGAWAQLLTPIASFSGLFAVTLSITYIIPVLAAANEKRQLAAMIRGLGPTPTRQVLNAWNGNDFDRYFERINQSLVPLIHLHNQRHLAYPVIHYFHSATRHDSLAVMIAVLDEALTMIQTSVDADSQPDPWLVRPARHAIAELLGQTRGPFVRNTADAPPAQPTSGLFERGIPLVEPGASTQALDQHVARRQQLAAFLADAGWDWETIHSPKD